MYNVEAYVDKLFQKTENLPWRKEVNYGKLRNSYIAFKGIIRKLFY